MPSLLPIRERRQGRRVGLRVIHRHQVGETISRRLSELLYVDGKPVALIEWIQLGEVRTPLYTYPLDALKLRPDPVRRGLFHYDELTADPRFIERVELLPHQPSAEEPHAPPGTMPAGLP